MIKHFYLNFENNNQDFQKLLHVCSWQVCLHTCERNYVGFYPETVI